MALSRKLQLIYENLLPGADVWDLCCDHGYVGRAALQSKQFRSVFFVDQVPHIIENLKTVLATNSQVNKARFLALAAEELQEPLTGTVVIAGVGAYTAFGILKTLWEKQLLQATRLILSPQRDEQKFIRWLEEMDEVFKHRYRLRSEQAVQERRRPLWVYVCGE